MERKKNLYRIFSLLIIIFDRKKKHHKDFLDSFVKFIIYLSHIFSSEISLCEVSSEIIRELKALVLKFFGQASKTDDVHCELEIDFSWWLVVEDPVMIQLHSSS